VVMLTGMVEKRLPSSPRTTPGLGC